MCAQGVDSDAFILVFQLMCILLFSLFRLSSKNNKALPDGVIYEGVSSEPLQVCTGQLHTMQFSLSLTQFSILSAT